jgi:hypothetical protein
VIDLVVRAGAAGPVAAGSLGSSGNDLFGGTDLLRLLVLAFGGALVVGNGLALWRSRSSGVPAAGETLISGETPVVPQVGRSAVMIGIGLIAAIWAIASLTM